MKNKLIRAFTLAEVLITLTIIGVIAAITIPNLMQSWRKHEKITQIRTAYSIIQNATRMAIAEHGNTDGWNFDGSESYTKKYFIPYSKTQSLCGAGYSTEKNCFLYSNGGLAWYYLNNYLYNGFDGGYGPQAHYSLTLQNGMNVAIWAPAKVLQTSNWARYVYFLVDVNGKQGPTTIGKDIFTFKLSIDTGKFTTGGRPANYNQNDCTLTGEGSSCAYWIERNHWEFPDDYPVKKF